VLPARLTMLSLASELLLLALTIGYAVTRYMDHRGVPAWTVVAAAYLFLEMALRFHIAWMQNRPAGSSLGVIAYILYWLVSGRRPERSPFERLRGQATPMTAAPEERRRADSLLLREPLATLLPASDQWRLCERYGYDYSRLAGTVAGVLLAAAILGVITSTVNRSLVTGLVALGVAAEQIVRLAAFRRGPQASILGWLVRPLLRNLL